MIKILKEYINSSPITANELIFILKEAPEETSNFEFDKINKRLDELFANIDNLATDSSIDNSDLSDLNERGLFVVGHARSGTSILMKLLMSLKDDSGRVVVEGFLDDIRPVSGLERSAIAAMPAVDATIRSELGLGSNEVADERLESSIMRPAIVVKGLSGGGVGAESRNIIEPTADASLNLRLVPGQQPAVLLAALKRHFESLGMTVSGEGPTTSAPRETHLQMVARPGGYRSFRTKIDAEVVSELKVILDRLGDQETLITPTMGGSLPIYLFEDNLEAPIVILPIANHDNNQHGKDENLRLKNLFDAIEMYAEVLQGLAAGS